MESGEEDQAELFEFTEMDDYDHNAVQKLLVEFRREQLAEEQLRSMTESELSQFAIEDSPFQEFDNADGEASEQSNDEGEENPHDLHASSSSTKSVTRSVDSRGSTSHQHAAAAAAAAESQELDLTQQRSSPEALRRTDIEKREQPNEQYDSQDDEQSDLHAFNAINDHESDSAPDDILFDDHESWGAMTYQRNKEHLKRGADSSERQPINLLAAVEDAESDTEHHQLVSVMEHQHEDDADEQQYEDHMSISDAPVSSIVSRYFIQPPKRKERESETQKKKEQSEKEMKEAIDAKLQDLEEQIRIYQQDNQKLQRLIREKEMALDRLNAAKEDFEKVKAGELQKFEQYKAQELKKLKNERRVFERQMKASSQFNGKKDREELEQLKSSMQQQAADFRAKESKWKMANERLQLQIHQLKQRNSELEQDIRRRELERIEQSFREAEQLQNQQQSYAAKPNIVDPYHDNNRQQANWSRTEDPSQYDDRESISSNNKAPSFTVPKSDYGTSFNERVPSQDLRWDDRESVDGGYHMPSNSRHGRSFEAAADLEDISFEADMRYQKRFQRQQHLDYESVDADLEDEEDAEGEISDLITKTNRQSDKIEHFFASGKREVIYANGTRKVSHTDGKTVIYFHNSDIKKTYPDGRTIYFYASANTIHKSYPATGLQVYKFGNSQIERHFADGTKEIVFPDKTVKYINADGSERNSQSSGSYNGKPQTRSSFTLQVQQQQQQRQYSSPQRSIGTHLSSAAPSYRNGGNASVRPVPNQHRR